MNNKKPTLKMIAFTSILKESIKYKGKGGAFIQGASFARNAIMSLNGITHIEQLDIVLFPQPPKKRKKK